MPLVFDQEAPNRLYSHHCAPAVVVATAAVLVVVIVHGGGGGAKQVSAVGVENVDLSSVVGSNHFNYNRRMPEILSLLALDDCSKYIGRGDSRGDLDSSSRLSASNSSASIAGLIDLSG